MSDKILKLNGKITQGYRIASGKSPDNPFPEGTIKLQAPFFKGLGLDLEKEIPNLCWGTLNVDISPKNAKVVKPDYQFKEVGWIDSIQPEHFSFVKVKILFNGEHYKGLIYYPHPETKPHMCEHKSSSLEIIAEYIPTIGYGSEVSIMLNDDTLYIY